MSILDRMRQRQTNVTARPQQHQRPEVNEQRREEAEWNRFRSTIQQVYRLQTMR